MISKNSQDNILKLSNDEQHRNVNQFSITLEQRRELYDREFNELMQRPKEELVRMLIGYKP